MFIGQNFVNWNFLLLNYILKEIHPKNVKNAIFSTYPLTIGESKCGPDLISFDKSIDWAALSWASSFWVYFCLNLLNAWKAACKSDTESAGFSYSAGRKIVILGFGVGTFSEVNEDAFGDGANKKSRKVLVMLSFMFISNFPEKKDKIWPLCWGRIDNTGKYDMHTFLYKNRRVYVNMYYVCIKNVIPKSWYQLCTDFY